jgi:hypothetical protein
VPRLRATLEDEVALGADGQDDGGLREAVLALRVHCLQRAASRHFERFKKL